MTVNPTDEIRVLAPEEKRITLPWWGAGLILTGTISLIWSILAAFGEYEPSVLAVGVLGGVMVYVGSLILLEDRFLRWMLIIPSTIILFVISIIPLGYLVYLSLHRITMINFRDGGTFAGFANFQRLLFDDPLFWPVLFRTLQYVVITLVFQLIIGMALALLLNREFPGQGFISNMLLIPIMTTPIVIANLWKYLLSLENGGINNMLEQFFGIQPVPWLTNQPLPGVGQVPMIGDWLATSFNMNYAFASVVLVNIWQWTPFVFLLLLAGLRSLPTDIQEAARVDGANGWQRFRFVTLPMLRPVIAVVVLIRLVDLIKVYDQIWALFGNATFVRTLNIHIFTIGISNQNYGLGAALSIIVLLIALILSVLVLSTIMKRSHA